MTILFNRSGDTEGIVYNVFDPIICGRRVIGMSCISAMRSRRPCNLSTFLHTENIRDARKIVYHAYLMSKMCF
jgi:hypothetical protein